MNVVWRILGFQLLAQVGARLPARYARLVTVALLVVSNLVPLVGAAMGWMSLGDVFAVYWLENVIVWIFSTIRIATAKGPTSPLASAAFFCFHYGIFTVVHGVFTIVMIAMTGSGFVHYRSWLIAGAALFVSHLLSLVIHWFGRGERLVTTPRQAMFWPYPRMLVLHVAIIGSFFLLLRGLAEDGTADEVLPVFLLVGLKLTIDIVLHVRERVRAAGGTV
ncbi:DUF6498-containing protein [Nocardioides cavernaquae]|uniref:Uncharacterized protein n=1 Tax=Nocardioides cavernaquae TaxID=2321396 RepID=A0A3A5HEQ1_9ACTN|nr:DUF6498-containing protein [Nocardioides cavernaquae]RJS46524.1 hypothetical protein D4739_10075 [Nocardioides cavernaquae]